MFGWSEENSLVVYRIIVTSKGGAAGVANKASLDLVFVTREVKPSSRHAWLDIGKVVSM